MKIRCKQLNKRKGWMAFYAFMIVVILGFYIAGTQMSAVDQNLIHRLNIFEVESKQAADSALAIAKRATASHTGNWSNITLPPATIPRADYAAVWTGDKMIIWGGVNASNVYTKTAGIYDPGTNSWTTASVINAPSNRKNHTAIWTGSELIIWGGENPAGSNFLKSGGKYNPLTNTWTAITLAGAPSARINHTAIWSGTYMVIWGGRNYSSTQPVNTGARYNPVTNSWSSVTAVNAPAKRQNHTAIRDGNLMIVWGGKGWAPPQPLNTGGRYNPNTNTWYSISSINAPSPRTNHTAVTNGKEMFIWGGLGVSPSQPLDDGGIYDFSANSWSSITGSGVARQKHSAIWMDEVMTVWGGEPDMTGLATNTGDAYRPGFDCWGLVTETNAPSARKDYCPIWTGKEMIIWGGRNNSGAILDNGKRWQPPASISQKTYDMSVDSAQIATISFQYELSSYTPAVVSATGTVFDRGNRALGGNSIKKCLDVERHKFCKGSWTK